MQQMGTQIKHNILIYQQFRLVAVPKRLQIPSTLEASSTRLINSKIKRINKHSNFKFKTK